VPLQALIDLEDRKVVYVVEGSTAARRTVTLGPTVGDRVVIEQGLAPGDRVIVRGQDRVAPGELVEPIQSTELVEPIESSESTEPTDSTPQAAAAEPAGPTGAAP